jgi:hypothetical protein
VSTESPSTSPPTIAVIPWQLTGNHWLSLPCIHPANGAVHAIGVLHRGARAAVEFAGGSEFASGAGTPLLRPVLRLDGVPVDLGAQGLAWERAHEWLPTFTCTVGSLVLRATVFAPCGRDADVAGVIYALALENRGPTAARATLSLEGMLGHRQIRVRTPRAVDDAHRVLVSGDRIILEGAAQPGLAAIAITGEDDTRLEHAADAPTRFALHRDLIVPVGGRASAAFYLAAGPDRDGAEATVRVMRRRGWEELLTLTREALRLMEQTVGHEGVDRLLNRNLLFAYFYAVGRALDDAHFYLVRTRAPWNDHGVTVRDWEALMWTLPAIQLADGPLARELLLRACELHGYAPGNGVHYFDGTLFEPGFSLEGLASFALAADRYIRETGDDQVVEEPVLADTLYLSADDLAERRDEHVPLYETELSLSGEPAPFPYTLHGNAVAAQALDVLRRTLDEESAREVEDPDAVRAALRRHFSIDRGGAATFASAIDLSGRTAAEPHQLAEAYWLPLYEAVERHDSAYRRTVRGVGADPKELTTQCARLIGPDGAQVMQWLRRAPLENGLAAEEVTSDGRALRNGGDASLSGLLAWSVWYAVHALGLRP